MFWSIPLSLCESSEWHSHDVFEIVFCRGGSGLLVLENQNIELCNRRVILIASKARHKFIFRESESADIKIVCITPADIATHLSAAQSAFLHNLDTLNHTFADYRDKTPISWELTEMIPDGLGNQEAGDLHLAWGIIGLFISSLMQGKENLEKHAGTRHFKTIQKVCNWLDSQPEDPGDLNEIAMRFGLSRSLLTREFRKHTNTSVVAYINIRRLQKAGQILSSTGKSIDEAAYDSGFSSLPNFYRRFKGLYGMSPAEFRNQFY